MTAVRSAGGGRRPRAEWVADATALREQGLTGLQIARRLGLSSSFVYDLFNDPTGAKAKARKQRHAGVCLDCGAVTYGGRGRANAPKYCADCFKIRNAAVCGTRSKYQAGCSCDACRAANAAATRSLKGKRVPHHGTVSGYVNYGCRCDRCRRAHSDYQWAHPWHQKAWRAKVRGTEPPRHGTLTGYSAYGCRCDACREAESSYRRERRLRAAA